MTTAQATIQTRFPCETEPQTSIVTTTPLSMINLAISQGRSPEELGKLLDLQERWERNNAVKEFAAAMNTCQSEMETVVKNRINDHTKSGYADLAAINVAIKPIYTRCGFAPMFSESPSDKDGQIRITCKLLHIGGHSETFYNDVPLDGVGIKGNTSMSSIQAKGSSLTYSRRYLLAMIFNISTGDDKDGNTSSPKINGEEIASLNNMIAACRDAGKSIDFERFLRAAGVPIGGNLGDITRDKFLNAMNLLTRKLAAKASEPVSVLT